MSASSTSFNVPAASARYNLIEDLLVRHASGGESRAPALYFEGQTITYGELYRRVAATRHLLRERGVGRGDRVANIMRDSPAYVYAFLAAISLGAIPVGLDQNQNEPDIVAMIQHVGVRLVFMEVEAVSLRATLGEACPFVQTIAVDPMTSRFLVDGPDGSMPVSDFEVCTPSDILYLTFSSGTTGRPKAVIRRHGDILECAKSVGEGLFGMTSNDVVLPVTKLTFGYSLVGGLMFTLLAGGALVVCPDRVTGSKVAELARRYRPTILLAQPRMLVELATVLETGETDWLGSLKTVTSAGDVLSRSVRDRWMRASGLPVLDGFGSVEVGHIFIGGSGLDQPDGATGKAMPGYRLRLVDGEANEVAEGTAGRLCIAGKSLTSGYWNDPGRTRASFSGDWYVGDDVFVRFGDQYHYAGRWDDLIKTGCGEWISPVRIEGVLQRDARILDCAVSAAADSDDVSRVKAFVVPAIDVDLSRLAVDIPLLVKQEWPGLEHMRVHMTEFVSAIPRSPNGKIMRPRLK